MTSEPIVTLAAETNRRLRLTDHEADVLARVLRRVVAYHPEEREIIPDIVARLERRR
jgi:hypothetical protein